MSAYDQAGLARAAVSEVGAALAALAPDTVEQVCDELLAARRIACYGVGREGLAIRALAMRLFHCGLDVHVVGDMTVPPLHRGDLLVVSAGPGAFATVLALQGVARAAGARVLCFTAQPDSQSARAADRVAVIPAQTMADDREAATVLPMGSCYESALLLLGDLVALRVRDRTNQSSVDLRNRHTNLE
jgi:6-phospho-3-hexuloisomerase